MTAVAHAWDGEEEPRMAIGVELGGGVCVGGTIWVQIGPAAAGAGQYSGRQAKGDSRSRLDSTHG